LSFLQPYLKKLLQAQQRKVRKKKSYPSPQSSEKRRALLGRKRQPSRKRLLPRLLGKLTRSAFLTYIALLSRWKEKENPSTYPPKAKPLSLRMSLPLPVRYLLQRVCLIFIGHLSR
jgi:hypothetical protein